MNKEKLTKILASIVLVVLGILIAIFKTETIDIYFGIVACIAGVVVLADTIFLITRKEKLALAPFVLAFVLLAIGITLFAKYLSFVLVINFLVVAILGTGVGLLCYGIYLLANKEKSNGLLNMVMGVVAVVLAVLYIAVPDFANAFWIIVGVVIAVYGVLGLVFALVEKKSK